MENLATLAIKLKHSIQNLFLNKISAQCKTQFYIGVYFEILNFN